MQNPYRDYTDLKNLSVYYIAGMISNLPIDVVKSNFARAQVELSKIGIVGVTPLEVCKTMQEQDCYEWRDYMVADLTFMMHCKGVYALRNWKQSKGANIEVQLALRLGLDVIYQ